MEGAVRTRPAPWNAPHAEERKETTGPHAPLWRRLVAEVAGTFALTLVAAGGDVIDGLTAGGVGHTARYLAPGLVLVGLIFALSGVSGAHFNPAVTLAFAVRGVFPWRRTGPYVAAQLAGATLAGLALVAAAGVAAHSGVTRPNLAVSGAVAAGAEALLTMILVFVILGTAEQHAVVGKNAAIAVGFTVAACGLCSSPMSGASMNPARSFGPALATLHFRDLWIDIAGPLLGSLAAAGLAQATYGPAGEDERHAAQGGT